MGTIDGLTVEERGGPERPTSDLDAAIREAEAALLRWYGPMDDEGRQEWHDLSESLAGRISSLTKAFRALLDAAKGSAKREFTCRMCLHATSLDAECDCRCHRPEQERLVGLFHAKPRDPADAPATLPGMEWSGTTGTVMPAPAPLTGPARFGECGICEMAPCACPVPTAYDDGYQTPPINCGTFADVTPAVAAAINAHSLAEMAPAPPPPTVAEAKERADKAMCDVFGGVDQFGDYCGHPVMPSKLAYAVQDLLVAMNGLPSNPCRLPDPLLDASRFALAVLTDLAESAVYWSDYDVPVGLVSRIDEAKARLAAALGGGPR